MAPHQPQPWWEQPAKSPVEAGFEAEREHLRAELARAWRAGSVERQLRDAHASAWSQSPPAAA